MALPPGTRLGPYEILSTLGMGGMGEVFRAQDTRLNRIVAIKVLPSDVRDTTDRRTRFQREARAIAALSHPNICAIFDVGEDNGVDYLVLEHLEGETLASALTRGALPIDHLLRIAVQITEALDAAHRQGIIHRDLKPANVFLTKSGAKLLDFGLAKLQRPSDDRPASGPELHPPTRTAALTQPGAVMGTPHYMAPEQIAGLDADARTDIFAFGAVLYEMSSGRRAFDGGSPTATIAAILGAEPPSLLAADPTLPPMLERVISACLAKAPEDRWQTARDLLRALRWTGERDAISVAPHAKPRRTIWLAAAAAAVATIIAAWLIAQNRLPVPNRAIHRLTVLPPEGATLVPGQVPLISPDGQRIVLNVSAATGSNALYARSLDSAEAQIVPGTHEAIWPFWSPDSQSIGFFAEGKLKTIRLGELTPRVITEAPMPRGGSWSRDGVILFTKFNNDRIYRVAAAGGAVTAVTTIDRNSENAHWWPQFLPDGQRFLYFVSSSARSDIRGVYLANLDGSRRRIVETTSNGIFVQPGFLMFRQAGSLVAQRFDITSGTLSGTPVVVAERLAAAFGSLEPFSLSDTGVLVLLSGAGDRQLAWYSRSGIEELVGAPGPYANAAVSKRGQVVFTRNDQILNTDDLWLLDMQRGIPTRVTSHPANDSFPIWLPTANAIVFASSRSGIMSLWRKTVADSAPEAALLQFDRPIYPGSQTPDGLWQLFTGPSENGDFDIGAARLDGSGKVLWPLDSEFDERRPILSPDGRWLAYLSAQSGRPEVFVTEFPGPGEKIPVSNGGGYEPKWRADGRELFYIAKDGQLMSVAIAPERALEVGRSQALFQTKLDVVNLPFFGRYDVTPDGQRFLMIQPSRDRATAAATVVLNWPALLPD